MRGHARISTSIWASRKFRALGNDDRARLLYFHFHTCSQVCSVGCFRLPIGYIVADLRWTEQQVRETIDRLSEVGLIGWDEEESLVFLVDYVRHDPPTNLKHYQSMFNVASALPDCPHKLLVFNDLLAVMREHRWKVDHPGTLHEIDRLSRAYEKPIDSPTPRYPIPDTRYTSSLRSDVSAAPSALTPALHEEPRPFDPVFISIPTNTEGIEHSVHESDISDYERTYPAVDVRQQIRSMRRWSMDNPKHRKTSGGMRRFINSWLAREQDKPHRTNVNGRPQKQDALGSWLEGARDATEGFGDGATDRYHPREAAAALPVPARATA